MQGVEDALGAFDESRLETTSELFAWLQYLRRELSVLTPGELRDLTLKVIPCLGQEGRMAWTVPALFDSIDPTWIETNGPALIAASGEAALCSLLLAMAYGDSSTDEDAFWMGFCRSSFGARAIQGFESGRSVADWLEPAAPGSLQGQFTSLLESRDIAMKDLIISRCGELPLQYAELQMLLREVLANDPAFQPAAVEWASSASADSDARRFFALRVLEGLDGSEGYCEALRRISGASAIPDLVFEFVLNNPPTASDQSPFEVLVTRALREAPLRIQVTALRELMASESPDLSQIESWLARSGDDVRAIGAALDELSDMGDQERLHPWAVFLVLSRAHASAEAELRRASMYVLGEVLHRRQVRRLEAPDWANEIIVAGLNDADPETARLASLCTQWLGR